MGIFAQRVDTEVMTYGIEEVVAGVTQRSSYVFLRVRVALRPDPALRRVAVGRILGENAFALYLGRGIKVDLVAQGLKVEPGAYAPISARLKSGVFSAFIRSA